MKRINPGTRTSNALAARRLPSVAAIALAMASIGACSNVIGLDADYHIAEPSCIETLGSAPVGSPCPADMLDVPGNYCIDYNETTWTDYMGFVALANPADQPPECADNLSFQPEGSPPVAPDGGADDYPVTGVDWCDALAYCKSKGKRLCGAIPDGADLPGDTSLELSCSKDEWYAACSAAGRFTTAEGSTGARLCNVNNAESGTMPVGTTKGCSGTGDYQNLKDMNGNVAEWGNACTREGTLTCQVRGGSFSTTYGDTCGFRRDLTAMSRNQEVGIRCCKSLP